MGVSDAVELTQVVASSAMVLSVVYLAKQRRENHIMMKMQFDFNLTERLDRRYFEASQNVEFTKFLSRDWQPDPGGRFYGPT